PIYSPVDERTPFDMGRIDSEKMYDIVLGWDWGNSGSPDIYHDPETRKNAITYRSNLARLVEVLLEEGKYDKAEVILDLAMKHMPVEYYDFYSLLEPFIIGYFEIGENDKAMELWEQVATKYQENLIYYSGLERDRQYSYGSEIITDIERYRSLLTILILNAEEEIAREKSEEFDKYQQLFQH